MLQHAPVFSFNELENFWRFITYGNINSIWEQGGKNNSHFQSSPMKSRLRTRLLPAGSINWQGDILWDGYQIFAGKKNYTTVWKRLREVSEISRCKKACDEESIQIRQLMKLKQRELVLQQLSHCVGLMILWNLTIQEWFFLCDTRTVCFVLFFAYLFCNESF